VVDRCGAGHDETEETVMSNATLWARPAWDIDRWVRGYFGPATANDRFKGFSPAAEKRSVAHLAETPPFAIRRSFALPVHVVLTVRVAGANKRRRCAAHPD
jgi:hypothetical protein